MLNMDNPDSSTVAILFQPEHLQVRADVPLAEAGRLSVGQPATIVCDIFPDRVFAGVVTRIVGEADLQRNTLQAKVRILDPDPRLRPEMLCRVKFFAPAGPAVLPEGGDAPGAADRRFQIFAPQACLVPGGKDDAALVWVLGDERRAERREVVLGMETREGHRSIREGLRPGDRVVLRPPADLREGRRLKPTEESS
jgi:multidrug efflux pump subunit AcrA (membrane-fusion protein)